GGGRRKNEVRPARAVWFVIWRIDAFRLRGRRVLAAGAREYARRKVLEHRTSPLAERVVEASDADRDGEEIEEGVISGQCNRGHECGEEEGGAMTKRAGRENKKWYDQFEHEHPGTFSAVEPERHLMGIPRERRWEWL